MMTEKIDNLFTESPEKWIESLPPYQRDRVNDLISKGSSLEDAANKWLSAAPAHTAPFGTESRRKVFIDKIWDEIEKFLCGDDRYEPERSKLLSQGNIVHTYFVGVISAAIAPALGSSAIFLAPVKSKGSALE